MTQMLTDMLRETMAMPAVKPTHAAVDEMLMEAERVVAVADSLRVWANNSPDDRATERWRAVALVREYANEKWSEAAGRVREMSPDL